MMNDRGAKTAAKHVALLRGINVGGKNMLPMKELVGLFTAAGCGEVATYIQSGNVVFRAEDNVVAGLGAGIAKQVEAQFALKVALKSVELGEDDYQELLGQGFSAEDIWDIGAIAAFFALSNRMANLIAMRPNDEFYLLGRLPKGT